MGLKGLSLGLISTKMMKKFLSEINTCINYVEISIQYCNTLKYIKELRGHPRSKAKVHNPHFIDLYRFEIK